MDEQRRLGASGIAVSALGTGTWAWGDRGFWGYGRGYGEAEVADAFRASLDAGIDFFDTAELYGGGASERLLGRFARGAGRPLVIASKFAPLPWRLSTGSLRRALEGTLARLGLETLDLYQVHWPYTPMPLEVMMDALAAAVRDGRVRAVGVSNFSADRMRRAAARLERRGVPLAANQVEYSLLKRDAETNGVLAACRELDAALIAYSPLAKGLLTGKYADPAVRVRGPRRFQRAFTRHGRERLRPLLLALGDVAAERGRTPAQVALNWLLCRDRRIVPIPGAKTAQQARQNAGAFGWRLTEAEFARLEGLTRPGG